MRARNSLLRISTVFVAVCIVSVFLCSCGSAAKIQYYSQKENYIDVVGTVSSIQYTADLSGLYIEFSELSPTLDDVCFKIVGKNLQIVQANGIDDKIKVGDQVQFTTAPKYFGNGYVMPIVAIAFNGESLLDFAEGYENLLDWLSVK